MFHKVPDKQISPVSEAELKQRIEELGRCVDRIRSTLSPGQARASLEPLPASSPGPVDERVVRRLLRARRLREQKFGADLFADPAWDILLEAYAAQLAQQRISVSGLCCGSAVPATTALRWIKKLEEDGWLIREADPFDARRFWLTLTDSASARLAEYFEAVWPSLFLL